MKAREELLTKLREANPIPDAAHRYEDSDEARALHLVIEERRHEMRTPSSLATRPSPSTKTRRRRRPALAFAGAAFATVVALALVAVLALRGGEETTEVVPTTTPTTSPSTTVPTTVVELEPFERVGADVAASTVSMWKVRYLSDRFMATGMSWTGNRSPVGVVLTSGDGVTWERVGEDDPGLRLGDPMLRGGIVKGASGWVALGNARLPYSQLRTAAVWTSADGTTWERLAHDPNVFGTQGYIDDAISADSGIIAVGAISHDEVLTTEEQAGFAPAVWASATGTDWVLIWEGEPTPRVVDPEVGSAIFAYFYSITVTVDGRIVAVGACSATEFCSAVWTPLEGSDWTTLSRDPEVFRISVPGIVTVNSVAASEDRLVAVGTDSGQHPVVWTSDTGSQWTRIPLDDSIDTPELTSVIAVDGGFVAAGAGWESWFAIEEIQPIKLWTSPDGATWTEAQNLGPGMLLSLAEHQGTLVALGAALDNDPYITNGVIWATP